MPLSSPGLGAVYRINVQLVQKQLVKLSTDSMQAKCQDCCDSEEMMLVIARCRKTGPKVDRRGRKVRMYHDERRIQVYYFQWRAHFFPGFPLYRPPLFLFFSLLLFETRLFFLIRFLLATTVYLAPFSLPNCSFRIDSTMKSSCRKKSYLRDG